MAYFSSYARLRRVLLFGLLSAGLVPHTAWAQSSSGVGIGTASPDPKAALDIRSTDKGLLIPRMDSAQRVAIAHPPAGLLVFQIGGREGLWYALHGRWYYMPDQRPPDNLGNHTATQPLKLLNQPLTNNGSGGLRIDTAGQVGIGTGAPTAPLHVSGTAGVNHNLAATGTFRASAALRPSAASNVRDGDLSTSWQAASTPSVAQWVEVDFGGRSHAITEYRVALPATGNPGRGWVLQGSQNGASWIDLHTVNAAALVLGGWGTYALPLIPPYRYYRLYFPTLVIANPQYNMPIAVAEWELRDTPDVPSSLALRVAPGALQLETGATIRRFSTDGTLNGNADDAVPTERAVRTYVDAHGADNLGDHTATRNLNLSTHQLTGNGSPSGLGITAAGQVQVPALAGTVTRPVQVDPSGELVASMPLYDSPPALLAPVGTTPNVTGNWVRSSGTRLGVRTGDRFDVFDISNPMQPQLLGGITLVGAFSFTLNGQYAYLVTNNQLYILDISGRGAPTVVSSIGCVSPAQGVAISGTRVYVIAGSQLEAFEVTNPASPQAQGTLNLTGNLFAVATDAGRLAIVEPSYDRLTIYDTTVPGLNVLSRITTDAGPIAVAVSGMRAYVTNTHARTLQVFDISIVTAPRLLSTTPTAQAPVGVNADGTHVYVVGSKFQVFDASTPTALRLVGEYSNGPQYWVNSVAVSGHFAYVLGNGELQTFRNSQPQLVSVQADGTLNAVPMSAFASMEQDLALNDHDLRLRTLTDPHHGLGFYGAGKPFGTLQPDGPVLYGNGGGALGLNSASTQVPVLTWTANQRVGIGTALPLSTLHVVGSLRVTSLPFGDYKNVQWDDVTGQFYYDNSSRRYKTRIRPLRTDFAALLRLTPVTYERAHTPGRREVGFIAEQADSLGLTPLVEYDSLGRPDGYNYEKSVVYLTALLAEERRARLTAEARLQTLEAVRADDRARAAVLDARLRALEAAAGTGHPAQASR